MNTHETRKGKMQKVGGAAALYIAASLAAAIPFFLLLVDYANATSIAQKVSSIVANYGSLYAMYLASYVFYGLAIGVVALALHDRLQGDAPTAARLATAVGLLWATALVASGMIWNYGMTTVISLVKTQPSQAEAVWQAIEPVSEALGGAGGELLGGLWVLLVSGAALRSGVLPKLLAWSGTIIGAAGLVSVVPALHDSAIIFGLALIPWFVTLGFALLNPRRSAVQARVPAAAPM